MRGNGTAARDTYTDMVERVARLQPGARINGVTVQNMAAQKRGRELYIGLVTDDPFGPVIAFGAGGTMTREMAVLGIPTVSVYQDELLDVDRYLLEVDAFVHDPALTAPRLLAILESAARKPANRALLDKGRQAYAMIKSAILGR